MTTHQLIQVCLNPFHLHKLRKTPDSNDLLSNSPNTVNMPTIVESMHTDTTSSIVHDSNDLETVLPIRQSTRIKHTPKYLDVYYADLPSKTNAVIAYPISQHLSTQHLSPAHKTFTILVSQIQEPNFYHKTISHSHWKYAMNLELKAMEDNDAWSLVSKPPNAHVIGCRWVYKVKLNASGPIERYEARLVAKGYNQVVGFDY
ncbi:Reverse transcriptase [Theobroma cacao]|nr:Reverse transcriptase [Theobroma cacao]